MKSAILTMALMLAAGPAFAFDLQGHRGARGLAPENTLPAFATALTLGVTTLEFDVNLSRDGRLVVGHDPVLLPHLARLDGKWIAAPGPAIWHSTLDALQRYDVGRLDPASRYGQTYPEQKPVDGTRMPLLEQVFALAAKSGNADVRFNIETKLSPLKPDESAPPAQLAQALVQAIRQAGLGHRSSIQSFDWRTLKEAAKLAPEIPRVHLTIEGTGSDNVQRGRPDASPWLGGLDADDFTSTPALIKAAGGQVWSPFWRNVTPALVTEARQLGLQVIPWTVNDPAMMEQLIAMQVDGLISDYPDRLRAVMQARGMALPRATPVSP
ncbi:MAG: glycerophosphodiester phosphodiesterase [Ferrovibrio sp.]|uniref:glycerophosphodiester phosphodiesterase n=1 Tax=Ferrovibrio sp. TaxID=1917215 RepID=UPI0026171327|nr:glycerophosphodiester phosphodiesterase [Ferrovibrio sp.]MCW0233377.1 glycerophosphodiester phosphodiesterase [Ferrovibrio sp.]